MAKPLILIAEDDADLLDLLQLMLEADFDLVTAVDGEDAISKIQEHLFHFVIVDMHLPIKSGLEVCEYISQIDAKDQPGILALSGDTSDQLIHQAYGYGVADYIVKPFNIVAFHQRVMRYSADLEDINKLREQDLKKRSVAETAMKQAASYGSGLELLAKLNRSRDVHSFMADLTSALSVHGYHTAVEFRYHGNYYHFDSDACECGENEKRVFQLLHNEGRIYNFGKRVIFNEVHSSILIKNMPATGTLSYDAAIDLFAKLIPALDSRFIALMHIETMQHTKQTLGDSIQMVTQTIAEIKTEREEHLHAIASTIGISFHELEMTEAQEAFFLDLIEKKLSQNTSEAKFHNVVTLLKSCVDDLAEDDDIPDSFDPDDHSDDVELF